MFNVILDAEQLPETDSFQVSFPVKVELIVQDGAFMQEPPVFIFQADEKEIPLPDIMQAFERDIDRIFDRRSRFQDDFPQEAGFGQPYRAVGKDDQRYDQQNGRQRYGLVFPGD